MAAMRAEMAAELERATAARQAVEKIADMDRQGRLLSNLRRRGAVGMLSDAHLMTIAPSVDPDTAEGQAALEKFQSANPTLFVAAAMSQPQTAESIVSGIAAAPERKLFGDKWAAAMVATAIKDSRLS